MKKYVQFLTQNQNGKIDRALGSDGIFILDGRNTLETMIDDATTRQWQLRKIHTYIGFEIRSGDLKKSNIIHTEYNETT